MNDVFRFTSALMIKQLIPRPHDSSNNRPSHQIVTDIKPLVVFELEYRLPCYLTPSFAVSKALLGQ